MTGDHGNEFDHGMLGHARLYDETIRVPFLINQPLGTLGEGEYIRQHDIGPTILDWLDIGCPDQWEGEPAKPEMGSQLMMNSAPQIEQSWIGIRSETWKLIYPYDWEQGFLKFLFVALLTEVGLSSKLVVKPPI